MAEGRCACFSNMPSELLHTLSHHCALPCLIAQEITSGQLCSSPSVELRCSRLLQEPAEHETSASWSFAELQLRSSSCTNGIFERDWRTGCWKGGRRSGIRVPAVLPDARHVALWWSGHAGFVFCVPSEASRVSIIPLVSSLIAKTLHLSTHTEPHSACGHQHYAANLRQNHPSPPSRDSSRGSEAAAAAAAGTAQTASTCQAREPAQQGRG